MVAGRVEGGAFIWNRHAPVRSIVSLRATPARPDSIGQGLDPDPLCNTATISLQERLKKMSAKQREKELERKARLRQKRAMRSVVKRI